MRVGSVLIIEPNNFRPSVLGNMRRQETCPVCNTSIRLPVLTFVLQGSFGKVENGSVLPRRRFPSPFGSLRHFDLNGAPTLARQVLFDNYFRDSQDAVAPTTSGLWPSEVNDSRHLRESSNDSVFAAFQDCSDIADC
jgi:hypothetical protein